MSFELMMAATQVESELSIASLSRPGIAMLKLRANWSVVLSRLKSDKEVPDAASIKSPVES